MSKKSKTKSIASSVGRVLQKDDPKRVARGEDMYGYGEQKRPCNFSLTPTAMNILDQAARLKNLSKSEYIEQWLRKDVADSLDTSEKS